MSLTRTVRALTALAVGLGCAVSGCSDNAKPKPLPSPSASSSSASPSATPPTMPAQARGTSAKSAEAFARFYVDLVNHASRTGDTSSLDQFGDDSCQSCQAISRNVAKIYDSGGRIESRGWSLRSVSAVPGQPLRRPILDLGVVQSPEQVQETSDGPRKSFEGGRQPMTMYLERTHEGWMVRRLDLVS